MKRIEFKNYPDTSTPISAESLNALQDNVEEDINDAKSNIESTKEEVNTINDKLSNAVVTGVNSVKLDDILIQYGLLSDITVPATSYDSITVPFEEVYVDQPQVFAQPKGNYNIICQVSLATSSQFILNVRSVDGAERTGRSFSWMAIGKWKEKEEEESVETN